MEMVAAFRTTSPNSGQSPAELLFGWKIRTVADIRNEKILQRGPLRDSDIQNPNPLGVLKHNASDYLLQFPGTQRKRTAQNPFLIGDFVTTAKHPDSFLKGQSPRWPQQQITKIHSRYTFSLNDRTKWNVQCFKRFNSLPELYQNTHMMDFIPDQPQPSIEDQPAEKRTLWPRPKKAASRPFPEGDGAMTRSRRRTQK